jgi:hypothetical protein
MDGKGVGKKGVCKGFLGAVLEDWEFSLHWEALKFGAWTGWGMQLDGRTHV